MRIVDRYRSVANVETPPGRDTFYAPPATMPALEAAMRRAADRMLTVPVMAIDPPDRSPSQQFAAAIGRLRAALRQVPASTEDVLEHARACGRAAVAAGHSIELLTDMLAGIVPDEGYRARDLSVSLLDAAVIAYMEAAETPTDAAGG